MTQASTEAAPYAGKRDTVFHRVWACPAFADQRRDFLPEWLRSAALREEPSSLCFTRAISPDSGTWLDLEAGIVDDFE